MTALWKHISLLSAAALVFVAVQANAAAGDAGAGEKLYKESCMSCHKEKPGKMAGKPVDGLVSKMQKYKDMACPAGKVAQMQKVLKPWGAKEMNDVATYLNGMK